MVAHDNLLHTVSYALRWVINSESEMSDPEIIDAPLQLGDYVESVLGESSVNEEIVDWALRAKIGDTWREDDLIITRI